MRRSRWRSGLHPKRQRLRHDGPKGWRRPSLECFPLRCPVAPESAFLDRHIRHYVYKSHRILFTVEEDAGVVRVLHIRHARRLALGEPAEDPDDR